MSSGAVRGGSGRRHYSRGSRWFSRRRDQRPPAPLEHGQRRVVLAQREERSGRMPEGTAEDRRDCCPPCATTSDASRPRARATMRLEGRPGRARDQVRQALPAGKLEATDVGHPRLEGARRRARGSPPRSARPSAPSRTRGAPGRGTAASPCGAARISALRRVRARSLRVDRGEATPRRRRASAATCALAERRERHVEMSDEAPRLGADHAAVADEVDGGRALRARARDARPPRRASSTPSSPAPRRRPSASPVRPPRRDARKTAQSSTASRRAAATSPPQSPSSAAGQRSSRPPRGPEPPSGDSPARKAAPSPCPGVAGGEQRARSAAARAGRSPGPAAAGRGGGAPGERVERGRRASRKQQDEPDRAEDADAAVPHDGEPPLGGRGPRGRRGSRRARRDGCRR